MQEARTVRFLLFKFYAWRARIAILFSKISVTFSLHQNENPRSYNNRDDDDDERSSCLFTVVVVVVCFFVRSFDRSLTPLRVPLSHNNTTVSHTTRTIQNKGKESSSSTRIFLLNQHRIETLKRISNTAVWKDNKDPLYQRLKAPAQQELRYPPPRSIPIKESGRGSPANPPASCNSYLELRRKCWDVATTPRRWLKNAARPKMSRPVKKLPKKWRFACIINKNPTTGSLFEVVQFWCDIPASERQRRYVIKRINHQWHYRFELTTNSQLAVSKKW